MTALRTPLISPLSNLRVKLEHTNPGGSHKARAARHIIRKAITDGELKPGGRRRIIEKSGGEKIVMTLTVQNQGFRSGVHACIPTVLGYWSIGFAAGSIGVLSGNRIVDVVLLAGLLYAGSAQFLFYGMTAAGAGPVAIGSAVLLVNSRYLLMSSSLSPYFCGQSFIQKFVGGALLTDETFGVAAQHAKGHGALSFRWLLGLNLTAYANWLAANLTGAALAGILPALLTEGLAFSLTAMFIGLLILNYFQSRHRRREVIAVTVSAGTFVVLFTKVDPNAAVLIATLAGATAAMFPSITRTVREFAWKTPS